MHVLICLDHFLPEHKPTWKTKSQTGGGMLLGNQDSGKQAVGTFQVSISLKALRCIPASGYRERDCLLESQFGLIVCAGDPSPC